MGGSFTLVMPGTSPAMTTWIERAPTFQPNNTLQKENARGRKRKRPWGAGAFSVNLGVVGVLNIHVATLGGCKEPREFREFLMSFERSVTGRPSCLSS
jgi:hypothetical protein